MFRKKIIATFAVFLLVSSLTLASKGFAQQSSESKARETVENFILALTNEDYSAALNLVIDDRFPSTKEQIEEYKSNAHTISNLEVQSVDVSVENLYFVNLKNPQSTADIHEVIPVKEVDGEMKLWLSKDDNTKTNSDFSIQTLADHYSGTGFLYGAHYTIDQFSIPSGVSNVVVQGWQYSSNSYPAVVSYQLAKDAIFGYTVYGSAVSVDYNGEFTITLGGAFEGSGFCIRIFVGNSADVNLAGNVMYNP